MSKTFFDTNTLLLRKELEHMKSNKNDIMIPYADYTIDKPPIFKPEEPVQLSFEDILRGALEDGRPLKPIRRRSDDDFTFKGTYEYIYDNNKGLYKCVSL